MTHENCENYRELLAASALTALDAADARSLETHLESCADCRLEMDEWEATAALVALEAKPLEPSSQVREQLLARVRAEGRTDSLASDRVSSDVSQGDGNVLTFARPPRKPFASFGSFGAIAAMILFAALILGIILLWQKNRNVQSELARLNAEVNRTRAELDNERAMGELLTSPDGHMAKLNGTNVAPGAHAMIAFDKSGHAMLMAKGMPRAPEGMAYQLWFIKDNKKMPGKVFTTDAAGNGMLDDQIPEVARNAAVFAITLEPKGGVQVPTGSIYLLSSS